MTYSEADKKKILVFPTIATLGAAVDELGFSFNEGADRLLLPWDLHRIVLTVPATGPLAVVALTQLRCRLPFGVLDDVKDFVSSWNSERISPTAAMRITNEGDLSLSFAAHLPIGAGISFDQLADFVYRACDVSEMAILDLQSRLGSYIIALDDFAQIIDDEKALHAQLFQPYGIDRDPTRPIDAEPSMSFFLDSTEPPVLIDEEPLPVTIQSIAEAWKERGIENMDIRDDFIVTGINNILMAAFIDNGPSILIRGHWDCALPQSEALKAFLIANDWNTAHPTTRALWVTEEDQLQLRVETAYPITNGLTPDQLDLFLTSATQDILSAIDSLSLEISGNSPVHWPEG
ncbi:YbjN domain-containing protein [Corynebacterium sp. H130]|uniref:YbjN domain-containing protein n=1 Tax=Corynebacterium sp. H130 TaxID=3133444 RepID=UPI0030AA821F